MPTLKFAIFPTQGSILPYILDDIKIALEKKNHSVKYFPLEPGSYQFSEPIAQKFCTEFKPDYVLMVGKNGFATPPGYTCHFFEAKQIPYVSLNFDFPYTLLTDGPDTHPYLKTIFIWDRYYVDLFKKAGFSNVHYLPLATHPERFKSGQVNQTFEISFAGTIDEEKIIQEKIRSLSGAEQKMVTEIIQGYLANPTPLIEWVADTLTRGSQTDRPLRTPQFHSLYYIAESKLNTMIRKQTLQKIAAVHPITLFGNTAWQHIHYQNLTLQPPVLYPEMGWLYRASKVNLNITAPQLVQTINQRVFDIGANQGFVLTDYREGLFEYFDQNDIVCYRSKDEMLDQLAFYHQNSAARDEKTQRLHHAVLKQHTWDNRINTLLEGLK